MRYLGLFFALTVIFLTAMPVAAQLLHATDASRPSFDVTSVKPSNPDATGLNFQLSPMKFAARHASLRDLIKFAYHVKSDDQLSGAPSWWSKEYFDVEAKASPAEIDTFNTLRPDRKMDFTRLLLQSLLEDRFHLKVAFETRPLAAYALVVVKHGAKLTEVQSSTTSPALGRPLLPSIGKSGADQLTATGVPMAMVADWLSFREEIGNRVVVDQTGLKGNYDFVLKGISFGQSPSEDSATSIFTAVQEQLGLKLEPAKLPVEVLVIRHVERPSEN